MASVTPRPSSLVADRDSRFSSDPHARAQWPTARSYHPIQIAASHRALSLHPCRRRLKKGPQRRESGSVSEHPHSPFLGYHATGRLQRDELSARREGVLGQLDSHGVGQQSLADVLPQDSPVAMGLGLSAIALASLLLLRCFRVKRSIDNIDSEDY